MTSTEVTSVALRPAGQEDAGAISTIHLAARAAATMPPGIHTDDEVRSWLAGRLREDEVWVAETDGVAAAYARFTDTWLDDLYVHPSYAGQGLGSALLDVVKARLPEGFGLWVFEMNAPARAFYLRHGLVEVERTDGSANEEKEPDIRMEWRPA